MIFWLHSSKNPILPLLVLGCFSCQGKTYLDYLNPHIIESLKESYTFVQAISMSSGLEICCTWSFKIPNFHVEVFQNIYNCSEFCWENRPIFLFCHVGTPTFGQAQNNNLLSSPKHVSLFHFTHVLRTAKLVVTLCFATIIYFRGLQHSDKV